MRLRMNDKQERRFEYLMEATGENTKTGALDIAAKYYLCMAGGTGAYPSGALEELMERAIEPWSVTPAEIAALLGTDELSVEYSHEWFVASD